MRSLRNEEQQVSFQFFDRFRDETFVLIFMTNASDNLIQQITIKHKSLEAITYHFGKIF